MKQKFLIIKVFFLVLLSGQSLAIKCEVLLRTILEEHNSYNYPQKLFEDPTNMDSNSRVYEIEGKKGLWSLVTAEVHYNYTKVRLELQQIVHNEDNFVDSVAGKTMELIIPYEGIDTVDLSDTIRPVAEIHTPKKLSLVTHDLSQAEPPIISNNTPKRLSSLTPGDIIKNENGYFIVQGFKQTNGRFPGFFNYDYQPEYFPGKKKYFYQGSSLKMDFNL